MMEYHHRTWEERYKRHHGVLLERTREAYRRTVRPRNIALYGETRSPKMKECSRNRSRRLKEQTGYTKTEADRQQSVRHYRLLRTKAITLYGGKCECCGEARYDMLTFDHKIPTYYKDKVKGVALTYDVIREYERSGHPNEKYRLLCWNCNMSRGHHGYCPHQEGYAEHEYRKKYLKLETIEAYGSCCAICGESHWEFLTIDHINGGGTRHRRRVSDIYQYLKDNDWPKDEYRLLCANCNCSRKSNGWSKEEVTKLGRP